MINANGGRVPGRGNNTWKKQVFNSIQELKEIKYKLKLQMQMAGWQQKVLGKEVEVIS